MIAAVAVVAVLADRAVESLGACRQERCRIVLLHKKSVGETRNSGTWLMGASNIRHHLYYFRDWHTCARRICVIAICITLGCLGIGCLISILALVRHIISGKDATDFRRHREVSTSLLGSRHSAGLACRNIQRMRLMAVSSPRPNFTMN